MQESCSSGSVGERGGNEQLYPGTFFVKDLAKICDFIIRFNLSKLCLYDIIHRPVLTLT